MAKISLFSFGKLKIPGLREAADHYLKSLPFVEEVELKASKLEGRSDALRLQAQLEDEKTLLEKLGREKFQLWLLDEKGKTLSSKQWAEKLQIFKELPNTRIVIATGSAQGWSDGFKNSAHGLLSLGTQTLAHDLARVVLLEQIFRAHSILIGHPYHIE